MTPPPATLGMSILALYRLARMLSREDGPAYAFLLARGWVARRYGDRSWQFEGVNCPLCLGFWLAWPIAALSATTWGRRLLVPLGLAGGATFIQMVEFNGITIPFARWWRRMIARLERPNA